MLQVRHGHLRPRQQELGTRTWALYVSQYRMALSRIRSLPASSNAFSSACIHRHVESAAPPPIAPLHRGPGYDQYAHTYITIICDNLTASLIAIRHISRCAIIPSTNNAFIPHDHTTDTSPHAVAALSSQGGKFHEVLVPGWAQSLLIREVQGRKASMQFSDGAR